MNETTGGPAKGKTNGKATLYSSHVPFLSLIDFIMTDDSGWGRWWREQKKRRKIKALQSKYPEVIGGEGKEEEEQKPPLP